MNYPIEQVIWGLNCLHLPMQILHPLVNSNQSNRYSVLIDLNFLRQVLARYFYIQANLKQPDLVIYFPGIHQYLSLFGSRVGDFLIGLNTVDFGIQVEEIPQNTFQIIILGQEGCKRLYEFHFPNSNPINRLFQYGGLEGDIQLDWKLGEHLSPLTIDERAWFG